MVNFADDTNIFGSGENIKQMETVIIEEMKKLKTWFDWNKLSLNVSKVMLFGKCTWNTKVRIELDGVEIERVHENRFIGVIVDDRLSWKPHIKHVQSKALQSYTKQNNYWIIILFAHCTVHWSCHIYVYVDIYINFI